MKKLLSSIALMLILSTTGFAEEVNPITWKFFDTVSVGSTMTITTNVPNHPGVYPNAGMQLLTPGFSFANIAECSSYNPQTGVCFFAVGNTVPKVISIAGPGGTADVKLCLDGYGVTCQHYTHGTVSILPNQFAYVVSSNNGGAQDFISICHVTNNGASFENCVKYAPGPPIFDSPQGISFNPAGNRAYVTNLGNARVSNCDVDTTTGVLSNCQSNATSIPFGGAPPGAHAIQGVAAISSGYAYVPYFANNSVLVYPLNMDGSFGLLTQTFTDAFSGPNSITLNAAGTHAYVVNSTGQNVSVCSVNSGNGDLQQCINTGSFHSPLSISFNSTGNFAYIADIVNNKSTVTICKVSPFDSLLEDCVTSDQVFKFAQAAPVSNIFMSSSKSYGYVPNGNTLPGVISICPISASGILGTCNSVSNTQFITPTGVAVNPVS